MYSAAKEVDGTGTVDTTSNAAERLKLNQATSTTASENSNQQVTVQRKSLATSLGNLFLPSMYSLMNDLILFLLSHSYHVPLPSSLFPCILLLIEGFPSHDPVTWYGVNYAGTQVTQWDFQTKRTCTSPARLSSVLKVPLCNLHPIIIYPAQFARIM